MATEFVIDHKHLHHSFPPKTIGTLCEPKWHACVLIINSKCVCVCFLFICSRIYVWRVCCAGFGCSTKCCRCRCCWLSCQFTIVAESSHNNAQSETVTAEAGSCIFGTLRENLAQQRRVPSVDAHNQWLEQHSYNTNATLSFDKS